MNFDESKIKRDGDGKFADKDTPAEEKRFNELMGAREKLVSTIKAVATKRNAEETAQFLGKEFQGIKGQDAINKLLQEKQGHIKSAFSRSDIGDIDLVWGDNGSGLKHIIQHRESQGGVDIPKFLAELTDVIENGEFIKINDNGRLEFFKDKKVAVITPELRGGYLTYLFTAYKTRKAPS